MDDNKRYCLGLVSVVTPTYKRSEKLPRAIESVLSQTYSNLELFVVNDNEPDDEFTQYVIDITEKYRNDSRFHLIIQEKHINGAVARNLAIRQAKGEYIAFLDDDDWWEPSKIEEQVSALSQMDESWGGASCLINQCDEKMNLIGKTRKYKEGYIYKDVFFMTTDVATGTLLLRHDALDCAGLFDENLLRSQDIQLLTQFTYKYKLKLVEKHLHNADHSDAQNRLASEEKFNDVVSAYFNSVSKVICTLSKREIRCAQCIRKFILGFILLKQHNTGKGLLYCLKGMQSPLALWKTFQIFIRKQKEKHF